MPKKPKTVTKPKLVTNKKVVKLYRGSTTVKNILHHAAANCQNLKGIVLIALDDKGEITSGWSKMLNTEIIGLLEVTKTKIVDSMKV